MRTASNAVMCVKCDVIRDSVDVEYSVFHHYGFSLVGPERPARYRAISRPWAGAARLRLAPSSLVR